MYFEFPGEKLFPRRSHFRGEAIFWGEAIFGEKPFSKKLSFPSLVKNVPRHSQNLPRTHSGESHLLVKKVPNNFLRRSHSPVPCLLFQKRKSLVSFKDSKSFNFFSSSHSGENPFTCKERSKLFSEEKPFSSSLFTISQEKISCVI